jgi:hypothetical protein
VRVKRVYSAVVVAILGFLFTLYLNSGDFFSKFENFLLFISYWIAPWGAVVWSIGGFEANGRSHEPVDFAKLPRGLLGLTALIVGFIASAPFQTSVLGGDIATATGLPIDTVAAAASTTPTSRTSSGRGLGAGLLDRCEGQPEPPERLTSANDEALDGLGADHRGPSFRACRQPQAGKIGGSWTRATRSSPSTQVRPRRTSRSQSVDLSGTR